MASPLFDLEALLAPIAEDSPSGSDCRDSSSPTSNYQIIKSARNSARAIERTNIFGGADQEAEEHWRKVIELAPKLITQESKDLEVASWFTEAMIRRHSFMGLTEAFNLIHGLIENFWDELYPMPDEDGIETRVSPLSGLNGEGAEGVLIAPIRNTLITEGNSIGPFTYWQYQQALEVHRISDHQNQEERSKKLGFTVEDVEKAIDESSAEYMTDLRDSIGQCIETYRNISRSLDERCGTFDSPPTSNIVNILEECQSAILHLGKMKFPVEVSPEIDPEEGSGDDATASETTTSQVVVGTIATREQAFKQLLDIAEFFRKTEPHSPVSYILEKSVKWGNMPLQDLMQELIPDGSSLQHYGMLTGVKTEDQG